MTEELGNIYRGWRVINFDMSTLCFKSSMVAQDDLDEEIFRAESALLQLI